MRKLFLLFAVAIVSFLPSCSNDEPTPESNDFRTRAVSLWYNSYIEAMDSLMEGEYAGDDNIYFALLYSEDGKKYLTSEAYQRFVETAQNQEGIWTGSEYGWQKTAYVVQITRDWVYDANGRKLYPLHVDNLLYVLYRGGKNYQQFAYDLAEGYHEFSWSFDSK